MELLYIYIYENGKNITHQGVNLSSKQFISTKIISETKEEIKIQLNIEKYDNNGVSDRFYSNNISNFRLLIGENGSGKSSVLNEIIDSFLSSRGNRYKGFIITDQFIICRNPLIKFDTVLLEKHFSNHLLIGNLDIIKKSRPKFFEKKEWTEKEATGSQSRLIPDYINDTSIVYLSNHLNLSEISSDGYTLYGNSSGREIDYMYYHDYTIANKIAKDQHSYISGLNTSSLPDGIMAYKIREFQRIVDFLLDEDFYKYLPDPSRFLDFDVDLEFDDNIEDFFMKSFTFNEDEETPIVDDLYRIEMDIENKGKEKFEFHLYKNVFYSILSITYGEVLRSKNTEETKKSIILDYYEQTRNKKISFEIFQKYVKNSTLLNQYVSNSTVLIEKIITFFRSKYSQVDVYNDSINFKINNIFFWTQYSDFLKSNEIRQHFPKESPYFISPLKPSLPDLSEGEKNLISIFSNLRETKLLLNHTENQNIKNLLILMDEPDLGVHPEWQRTFLSSFIKFINDIFKQYNCQIISTSHSPFFTSDIFSRDITFLRRISGDAIVEENRNIKTFGSNIYDLFSDSFYMNKGFIGEFAKEKINSVIEFIEKGEIENENWNIDSAENFIELIGEPLIRNELRELFMKAYFDDKQIDNEIERLKKIKKLRNKK